MWAIDVIGMIHPKASKGNRFILIAIDCFTKWVEAASFANLAKSQITRFIKQNIVYRYGLPHSIITNNVGNLNKDVKDALCVRFKIHHQNSTPYKPKMKGVVKVANKNTKKIL